MLFMLFCLIILCTVNLEKQRLQGLPFFFFWLLLSQPAILIIVEMSNSKQSHHSAVTLMESMEERIPHFLTDEKRYFWTFPFHMEKKMCHDLPETCCSGTGWLSYIENILYIASTISSHQIINWCFGFFDEIDKLDQTGPVNTSVTYRLIFFLFINCGLTVAFTWSIMWHPDVE